MDDKSKYVSDIVAAGAGDIKAVLKGHGIGGIILKQVQERVDAIARLAVIGWTLKTRGKGAQSLKKTNTFKIVGYKSAKELVAKIDNDIAKFSAGLKGADAESFDTHFGENVVVIAIVPNREGLTLQSLPKKAKFEMAATGASATLPYNNAINPSYQVAGAFYLAAFVADSAIFQNVSDKADVLAQRNRKLNAKKTSARLRAQMKRGAISQRKWKIKLKQQYAAQANKFRILSGAGDANQFGSLAQLRRAQRSRGTTIRDYINALTPEAQPYAKRALKYINNAAGDPLNVKRAKAQFAAAVKMGDGENDREVLRALRVHLTKVYKTPKALGKLEGRAGELGAKIQQLSYALKLANGAIATAQAMGEDNRQARRQAANLIKNIALLKERAKVYGSGKGSRAVLGQAVALTRQAQALRAQNMSDANIIKALIARVDGIKDKVAANKQAIAKYNEGLEPAEAVGNVIFERKAPALIKQYLRDADIEDVFNGNDSKAKRVEKLLKAWCLKNNFTYNANIYDIILNLAIALGWTIDELGNVSKGSRSFSVANGSFAYTSLSSAKQDDIDKVLRSNAFAKYQQTIRSQQLAARSIQDQILNTPSSQWQRY
jgi:hypothetical protein